MTKSNKGANQFDFMAFIAFLQQMVTLTKQFPKQNMSIDQQNVFIIVFFVE